MPRGPRPTHAGLYHLISGATRPDPFFRDDRDSGTFIVELARVVSSADLTCVAFALLTTHYHLIVDAPEGALAEAMRQLNWRYARAANRRHGRRGHAVGGRYASIPIVDDPQLLTCFRYVAWNPVEAGMCERPGNATWSSYATTVGLAETFPFVDASIVIEQFGPVRRLAIAALRRFVEGL